MGRGFCSKRSHYFQTSSATLEERSFRPLHSSYHLSPIRILMAPGVAGSTVSYLPWLRNSTSNLTLNPLLMESSGVKTRMGLLQVQQPSLFGILQKFCEKVLLASFKKRNQISDLQTSSWFQTGWNILTTLTHTW